MSDITLPELISSKIISYKQFFLVKSNTENDIDAIFDQEHIIDMCNFLCDNFSQTDYIIVNGQHQSTDKKITLDQVSSLIINFISNIKEKRIRLAAYYPDIKVYDNVHLHDPYGGKYDKYDCGYDKYDDYEYESEYIFEKGHETKRRRFITMTIKKKYLNIP